MSKCVFAVVDTETTGFWAEGNDRIVEIAIVRRGSDGKTIDEYATLVNPGRDLGSTHVHGIRAREVRDAPPFAEIAGDVVRRLADAVFVAHNATFDRRFVCAEFERVACRLPEFPVLCTMRLARRADCAIPSRKLECLCRHFGVPMAQAHSALDDARATAGLLLECGRRCSGGLPMLVERLGVQGDATLVTSWPTLPATGRCLRRESAARAAAAAPSWIARLIARLPAGEAGRPEIDEYMALLDRVLEDRRVTPEEGDALYGLARGLNLRQEEVVVAHRLYLGDMLRTALADDVISDMERRDLDEVRSLLQITTQELDAMLEVAMGTGQLLGASPIVERPPRGADRPDFERRESIAAPAADFRGRRICFTGTLCGRLSGQPIERADAERIAAERGMEVVRSVTKKLDFLVAADPDSMSTKAEKARQYGIRIISEAVFWKMVGVSVE